MAPRPKKTPRCGYKGRHTRAKERGIIARATRRLDGILDNLRNFAEASCEPDMAIICAVGEKLTADATLFGRAVTALDGVPLRLVSQAASRRNITFVLRDADVPHAMMRLHETFF